VRASLAYMSRALSEYSSTLSRGLDKSNAVAVFATAALIAFQSSASRLFTLDDGLFSNDGASYVLPLSWFHSFQGVKTVVLSAWTWICENEAIRPIINMQPASSLYLSETGRGFFAPLMYGLPEVLKLEGEKDQADTRQAFSHAIAYLSWAHGKPDLGPILSFPAAVSRRFVKHLEIHTPLALSILAIFFAMTRAIEHDSYAWYLKGVARREVDGIWGMLPADFRPMIEWAMRVTRHKGPLSEVWGCSWSSGIVEEECTDGILIGDSQGHLETMAQSVIP